MSNNYSDSEMDPSVWQQMVYKSNYTETINKQMRVPDTITVVENDHESEQSRSKQNPDFFTSDAHTEFRKPMEVPDRIVVSVGDSGVEFGKGERDFSKMINPSDEISHIPVSLQTPPRVLTLEDRNLDSLDIDLSNTNPDIENSSSSPYKRPTFIDVKPSSEALERKTFFENLQTESKRFYNEVLTKIMKINSSSGEVDYCETDQYAFDDQSSEDLDEMSTLQREVIKLQKEVALLKGHQINQTKIDYCVYGVTVALWLLNGWFLYSNRRLY